MTAVAYERPIDLGVRIQAPDATIEGDWSVPLHPKGAIILANGTGNSRLGRHNRKVARDMYDAGYATLLLDLLTFDEEKEDRLTGAFQLDVPLFVNRLLAASRWVKNTEIGELPLGYLVSGIASGAAIVASVREPGLVRAIVSRGGRPDLAGIEAEPLEPLEGEAQNLGIGRRCVGPADGFDPGLQELAGFSRAQPEDRTAIAVGRRLGAPLGQVPEADRNGVFGPQAQFDARGVLAGCAQTRARFRRRAGFVVDHRSVLSVGGVPDQVHFSGPGVIPAVARGPERAAVYHV